MVIHQLQLQQLHHGSSCYIQWTSYSTVTGWPWDDPPQSPGWHQDHPTSEGRGPRLRGQSSRGCGPGGPGGPAGSVGEKKKTGPGMQRPGDWFFLDMDLKMIWKWCKLPFSISISVHTQNDLYPYDIDLHLKWYKLTQKMVFYKGTFKKNTGFRGSRDC